MKIADDLWCYSGYERDPEESNVGISVAMKVGESQ